MLTRADAICRPGSQHCAAAFVTQMLRLAHEVYTRFSCLYK